jgi:TDG/mug DNA glycosylase family protein
MRKDSVRSDPGFDSGLAPVIGRAPILLILGSFPSRRSLEQREYYANPRNQFWQILETLFGIGCSLEYRVKIDELVRNRVALWDVIGACRRAGSADHRITAPSLNPIRQLLASCPTIRGIACNGTTAVRYLDRIRLPPRIRIIPLPSTSPANTRFTLAEKTERWMILKEIVTPEK